MIGFWTRFRIVLCGLAFAALAVLIGRRAYDLQVRQGDKLRSWAEDNYLKEIELAPQRGRIFDRNGKELASTAQFDSVFCNPRQLAGIPDAPRRLAKALSMDARELKKTLTSRRAFAWIRRKVTPQEAAAVKALGLPGVVIKKEPGRFYPFNELASTVVGHAGIDGKGLEGVELAFEKYLHGAGSQVLGIRDALGRDLLMDGLADQSAAAGKDVVLSVDKFLTYTTEQALLAAVHKHNAKGAVSVMMDPRTGEVLAMASVPSYNPNEPGDAVGRGATKNRAITDQFEPGSIMKAFTFAAAFDAGTLHLTDWFDCMWGRMPIGKVTIRDSHPLGTLIAADVFKHSSNIGTTKIARRLGREKLYDALTRFGFGHKTGIGLGGELNGILHPVAKWGEVAFANISFGQGLTVTPLQIAAGYAAIAAGGVYHPPRLGLRVIHQDGHSEALPLPPAARPEQRVISESVAHTMLDIMKGVTEKGGTATRAAIDGYPVAGKTGTGQKAVNGHYNDAYWLSSFVGVVPADNPRLVIVVMVDEPKPDHLGGLVAAPVFKEIAEAALGYLGVPPSEAMASKKKDKGLAADAKVAALPADRESAEGLGSDVALAQAQAAADADGQDVPIIDGEDVDGAEGVAATDRSDAPSDLVNVPSFKGLSIGQVIGVARRLGLEVAPEGSGLAVAQAPGPGSLPRGSICRVTFRPGG